MTRRVQLAVIVAALLIASDARAQRIVIGVQGGTSSSWRAGDRAGRLAGYTKGLHFTGDLNEVISIQAEVNYSQKGWRLDLKDTRLTYIETPVLMRVTPYGYGGFRPYAIAGIAYAREYMCDI